MDLKLLVVTTEEAMLPRPHRSIPAPLVEELLIFAAHHTLSATDCLLLGVVGGATPNVPPLVARVATPPAILAQLERADSSPVVEARAPTEAPQAPLVLIVLILVLWGREVRAAVGTARRAEGDTTVVAAPTRVAAAVAPVIPPVACCLTVLQVPLERAMLV